MRPWLNSSSKLDGHRSIQQLPHAASPFRQRKLSLGMKNVRLYSCRSKCEAGRKYLAFYGYAAVRPSSSSVHPSSSASHGPTKELVSSQGSSFFFSKKNRYGFHASTIELKNLMQ